MKVRLTKHGEFDGLFVFAISVFSNQRILSGIFAHRIHDREIRVIFDVIDLNALGSSQWNVISPDPFGFRWRFTRYIHRPFVSATSFDDD